MAGYFEPLFLSPYFMNYVLPFVLVFTLIFAILEKTKLLGEGKMQISAIVGLVVGLILIATPPARNIVVGITPFLAVFAVILLVFMLLYGFIGGKKEGDVMGKWWKRAWAAILFTSLVVILLIISGFWDTISNILFNPSNPLTAQLWVNGILIAVIVGVVVAVIQGERYKGS